MPSMAILKQLLDVPDTVDSKDVPAKAWLEETTKKDVRKGLVPHVGCLSLTICAQIANWFEEKISKNKKIWYRWLGLLPIAHAHTVYITTILKADPENERLTDAELLQRAWKVQFSSATSILTDVDVDKDCLALLEEEMFERSARAGVAGHCQWGLDIGDHDGWDPYRDVPGYFNHGV
jgi:hypothetical protein